MDLLARMAKARVDRKMTQAQLADRLGVKQAMVSMMEKGEEVPGGDLVKRIKAWLDSGQGARVSAPRGPRGNYNKRSTIG